MCRTQVELGLRHGAGRKSGWCLCLHLTLIVPYRDQLAVYRACSAVQRCDPAMACAEPVSQCFACFPYPGPQTVCYTTSLRMDCTDCLCVPPRRSSSGL